MSAMDEKKAKLPMYSGPFATFPRAFEALADCMAKGLKKHGKKGKYGILAPSDNCDLKIELCTNAMLRHLSAEILEGPHNKEDDVLHATQVAWNAMARLELMLERGVVHRPVVYRRKNTAGASQ